MGSPVIFKGKLAKFLTKLGILIPKRPTTDRSGTPEQGETAFNTTDNKLEVWDGSAWTQLGSGGGTGGVASVNAQTGNVFLTATDIGAVDKAGDIMSGALVMGPAGVLSGQAGKISFRELATNGTHSVSLVAPDSIESSISFTLPASDGTSGQVLSTNGSGTLNWASAGGGEVWTTYSTYNEVIPAQSNKFIRITSGLATIQGLNNCTVVCVNTDLHITGDCANTRIYSYGSGAYKYLQFDLPSANLYIDNCEIYWNHKYSSTPGYESFEAIRNNSYLNIKSSIIETTGNISYVTGNTSLFRFERCNLRFYNLEVNSTNTLPSTVYNTIIDCNQITINGALNRLTFIDSRIYCNYYSVSNISYCFLPNNTTAHVFSTNSCTNVDIGNGCRINICSISNSTNVALGANYNVNIGSLTTSVTTTLTSNNPHYVVSINSLERYMTGSLNTATGGSRSFVFAGNNGNGRSTWISNSGTLQSSGSLG